MFKYRGFKAIRKPGYWLVIGDGWESFDTLEQAIAGIDRLF